MGFHSFLEQWLRPKVKQQPITPRIVDSDSLPTFNITLANEDLETPWRHSPGIKPDRLRPPPAHRYTNGPDERKPSRFSISRKLNRKYSEPVLRRPAWISGDQNNNPIELDELIPAVPTIPAKALTRQSSHHHLHASAAVARPRPLSRRVSTMTLTQRLSRQMWMSANPDDEAEPEDDHDSDDNSDPDSDIDEDDHFDEDRLDDHGLGCMCRLDRAAIPPVPALVRTDSASPEDVSPLDGPEHPFTTVRFDDEAQWMAGACCCGEKRSVARKAKKRGPPTSRKAFVPKYAAAGHRLSAGGITDAQRKSVRRSMGLTEDADVVGVTVEQAAEWEKLKASLLQIDLRKAAVVMEDGEGDRGDDGGKDEKRETFANHQALKALEG